ncbi:hypothetical protein F5884DRAFT_750687 [Xylogone sp. PMI_703]|nr:hypothetical protein F5884DRAFT_750687 [Xylogone sp. PMI_703]
MRSLRCICLLLATFEVRLVQSLQTTNITLGIPIGWYDYAVDESLWFTVLWQYTETDPREFNSLSMVAVNSSQLHTIYGHYSWANDSVDVGLTATLSITLNPLLPVGHYKLVMDLGSDYVSPESGVFNLTDSQLSSSSALPSSAFPSSVPPSSAFPSSAFPTSISPTSAAVDQSTSLPTTSPSFAGAQATATSPTTFTLTTSATTHTPTGGSNELTASRLRVALFVLLVIGLAAGTF